MVQVEAEATRGSARAMIAAMDMISFFMVVLLVFVL
jgi:hypothetical protein